MLRNLLGENIDLAWRSKKDLWPVEIDPTQFDQILENLCINVRDAIEDVGKMTIKTDMTHIDKAYCELHPDEVQLLLIDVVMPDMNGRELAKQINILNPAMKVLYMSGYTANVIAHHGVLDEGINFMEKPFSRAKLSSRIREILTPTCQICH